MKKIESQGDNLCIVSGDDIRKLLAGKEEKIIQLIRDAYISHQKGDSSFPHSTFLRFPTKSQNRIIGLPAYINKTAGIKWIASFPNNIAKGIDRASATIILNSLNTGRPYAIIEGSIISAKRTAASAALAVKVLSKNNDIKKLAFVGCGLINFEILIFLISQFHSMESISLFDLDNERAHLFSEKATAITNIKIKIINNIEDIFKSSEVVSFATTASTPYIMDKSLLQKGSIVLHISLRDLGPDVIKNSLNVVDNLEHVNRENTSIYLASQTYGNTNFVAASLGELLFGLKSLPNETQPLIFSPFGLGILDIQLAKFVYEQALKQGMGVLVKNFIPPSWYERSY
ncbi:MAG: 2,3-diaminopropionate biosynthesis protein SbnB [Bacteroidota bacterium]